MCIDSPKDPPMSKVPSILTRHFLGGALFSTPPVGRNSSTSNSDFPPRYVARCFCRRVSFEVSNDPMTAKRFELRDEVDMTGSLQARHGFGRSKSISNLYLCNF